MKETPFPLELADYHTHSWHSDGLLSPAGVVEYEKNRGMLHMALTDHDTVEGVAEAQERGADLGIRVLPGLEISTFTPDNMEVHILGYGIDCQHTGLLALVKKLQEDRRERNRRLLEKLAQEGYPLEEAELKRRPQQTYIGKPHMARAMVAKGWFEQKDQVFQRVFEQPAFAEIRRNTVAPQEAVALIVEAGGLPVLAHPGLLKHPGVAHPKEAFQATELLVRALQKEGLQGIECYYPKHTPPMEKAFLDLAQDLDLYPTKGSDFHGD